MLPPSSCHDFLHRTGKKTSLNFIWNHREPHSQDNPKEKKQKTKNKVRGIIVRLLTILQGNSNQNSMVLVPKQRHRLMEQNRGLGGNATHLQPTDL